MPYAWLALFFLVPFAIVFKISLAEQAIGIPPYTPLLAQDQSGWHIQATSSNYAFLLSDSLYARCLSQRAQIRRRRDIDLPADRLSDGLRHRPRARGLAHRLLLLVILPFWTSFLIRVYAWIGLLKGNGLINNALLTLGLIHEPLRLLNNAFAVA